MSDHGTKSKEYAEAMKWRDWQTCDLIVEEHQSLLKQIQELKEREKMLVEALEFYADRFSWDFSAHHSHEMYAGAIKEKDTSELTFIETDGDVFTNHCGGKLARQTLAKLKGSL